MTFVPADAKILSIASLQEWRGSLSSQANVVVATNGCFDVLHVGHLQILEAARCLGSALIVGITCDVHVRRLKGQNRPILAERDRAMAVAALGCVSCVTIFNESDATAFLAAAAPNIYVKGGDYALTSINQQEREFLERSHVDIRFLPYASNYSTTAIIDKIRAMAL